ncbi:MAG: DUF6152 family protein [Burkholderiaceae bacterium]
MRAAWIAAIAALVALAVPAFGHHAWNEIDTARSFALDGRVKSLKWENPHASLVLEVSDGDHKGEWTVLMSGLARMDARGVAADTVAVGKTLVLAVSPSRGDARVVRANRITSDGHEYVLY